MSRMVGMVRMPEGHVSPVTAIMRRVVWAVIALFAATLIIR